MRLALEDQRRGVLIEQLLCQLKTLVSLGLVERACDVLSITDQGRPYARYVAAAYAAAHKIPPLVGKLS
ncbi:MAG: hypothetical protein CFE32_20200 [Alphaproteobacteria bacterium PA3]|nr:MAG: hypothetical protein CFE32_20200 [Alphaproteobacteria bacterium PA3]